MSLKEFILSKAFVKNLGLAVAIAVGALMLLLIWLNIYTRHGQSRSVPDFYGLTIEESAKLAKKSKLKYTLVDSVYTTLVPRGTIAEQNPKAGFKVKKHRTISLTINAFNPEMVKAPDLVNLPQRQALLVIESAGLVAGHQSFVPDMTSNFVLRQLHNGKEIKPGDLIQKGSTIDLVIGGGLSNIRTAVPNLVGLHLERAKNTILSASLNLGAFDYDSTIVTADDSVKAFVYKQNPEFREDATLRLGDFVYVWLSVDSSRLPVDSTLVVKNDSIKASGLINRIP